MSSTVNLAIHVVVSWGRQTNYQNEKNAAVLDNQICKFLLLSLLNIFSHICRVDKLGEFHNFTQWTSVHT